MATPAQRLLRPPAIALIAVGALLFVVAMLRILAPVLVGPDYPDPIAKAFGEGMGLSVPLMTLASSHVCVVAGIVLLRGRGLALGVTAAVLLINPVTSNCLLLPAAVGIWLLVVLRKPEVRAQLDPPLPTPAQR